jgi:hypothetical protein
MPGDTDAIDAQHDHTIDDHDHFITGFTVELHPSGTSMYGSPGQQVLFIADNLMGAFDTFHEALDDDPHIIEDDAFAEALIDYIVDGIRTDIRVLREHSDAVDTDTEPYADALEASLDELQTELSVWIAEYRRYVRLAHADVRDDRRVLDFEHSHPYNFHGITDTYDIIVDTIEPYLDTNT